jgi:tetratricopeptide (TPR) repeat protein
LAAPGDGDPAGRYPTAHALAADVQRWLADEPVSCFRDRPAVRAGRWARRHRTPVAAAAALLVTAVIGLTIGVVAVSSEQGRTAAKERLARTRQVEAERARDAEARRRRQAREALDDVTSEVVENLLAGRRELLPEQRDFLNRALARYEEFAADLGPTEEARTAVVGAYYSTAGILTRLGRYPEAEAAYARAAGLCDQLAAESPGRADYARMRGRIRRALATTKQEASRPAEAVEDLRAARDELLRLVEGPDADAGDRDALANCHVSLGQSLAAVGRDHEAEADLRAARVLLERMYAERPDNTRLGYELALALSAQADALNRLGRGEEARAARQEAEEFHRKLAGQEGGPERTLEFRGTERFNLGVALAKQGKNSEAESAFRDAVSLRRQLVEESPAVPRHRADLAASLSNVGGSMLADTARYDEAEQLYREALALRRRLAEELPTVPEHQGQLGGALSNLAMIALSRGRPASARPMLEEAITRQRAALKANPNHPLFTSFLGKHYWLLSRALSRVGDHEALARLADEAVAERAHDGAEAARWACSSVRLACNDARQSEEEREALAARYADAAMGHLRKAAADGIKDAAALKNDPELIPLRGRADFRAMVDGAKDGR